MGSLLIVYASSEGQTASVADHIADTARDAGLAVTITEIEDAPGDLEPSTFDGGLVGVSIHMGKHQQRARRLVTDHRQALRSVPSGFFQVSLSSGLDDQESQAEAAEYVSELVDASGWEPDRIGLFGCALKFGEYGWLKRKLMASIAKTVGEDDTGEDIVYTDFDAVTAFAEDFVDHVEASMTAESPA